MDTMEAFARGLASRGNESMVFDWCKAARIIKERKPELVEAGLAGDWEWTGGRIYKDGAPVPGDQTYTFLASTWAEPMLEVDGEFMDCYLMKSQSPGWDSSTYWPQEALDILNSVEG